MYTNNKITKAMRLAAAFGAVAAATVSTGAFAQETEDGAKVERINVTGSRIKRTDLETASPVSVFNAEDIRATGAVTISEFLRTSAATGGFNESQGLAQSGGAASVGIKGFSREYTLVLLNGRRMAKNSAGGIFTDINQLPMAAVERIEVLGDGASAVYGSDAVAGVINVITKKSYDGVNLNVQTGMGLEHKDGKEQKVSLVAGASADKTSILFAAEYFKRDSVPMSNRSLGNSAVLRDSNGNVIPGGEGRSTIGTPGYTVLAGAGIPVDERGNKAWADCPADQIDAAGRCLYDVGPLYFAQPKGDRASIFTQLTHEYSDDLEFNASFRYNRAFTLNSVGAAPGGVVVAGGAGRIAPSDYVLDYLLNDRFEGDQVLYQQALDAFAAGTGTLQVVRRYLDFGNREKEIVNQTYEAAGGFDYRINDEFNLTGDIGYSRLTNSQIGTNGQMLSAQVADAFVSGALNPFVVNDCSSAELKATCDSLNAAIHRSSSYEIGFGSLTLSGALPFELSGGQIGVATGIDVRNESYKDVSDPSTVAGQVLGGAGSNGGGSFSNQAAFVEFALPITDQLELTLAGRHDKADWGLSKDTRNTYSTKFTYRPTDELLFRGSIGTGFKAPNLGNLFLGVSQGVTTAIDTKLCREANSDRNHPDCQNQQLGSRSGGNPELTSERSKTATVGVVYEPIDNLSIALDYWTLKIDNIVGQLLIQEILNEEAEGRLTELVNRAPDGTLTDPLREGFVRTNYQNLNERDAKGFLLDISDRSDIGFGILKTSLKAEYRLKDMTQASRVQPLCDATRPGDNWNVNANFTLDVQDFTTSLSVRYLPGYKLWESRDTANKSCDYIGSFNQVFDDEGKRIYNGDPLNVSSYMEVALSTTYNWTDSTAVTVGIRNLFDRNPPISDVDSWPFYDQDTYSNMGRYVYVGFDFKF